MRGASTIVGRRWTPSNVRGSVGMADSKRCSARNWLAGGTVEIIGPSEISE